MGKIFFKRGSYDEINNEDGEFIRLAKRMRGDNVE